MDSREDFPRVSLATVNDWHRLKSNYTSAVLDVLEEHIQSLPPSPERETLLAYTNQYIERVFEMAQPNLRVNGHNFESLDQNEQNTEPFDEALDRRIWSLANTRLQWQKRIAETRRTLPHDFEGTIHTLLNQQRGVDAETTAAIELRTPEDVDPDAFEGMFHLGHLNNSVKTTFSKSEAPHEPPIEEGFQKTAALSEELDQTTASQEERAARARIAAGEMKALKT
ncbi:hypothetical protein H0H93_013973 [Arthromyces matolae]|nr:hypothetical protein H0H93_013973 [Arthromyces matolae]